MAIATLINTKTSAIAGSYTLSTCGSCCTWVY